MRHLILFGLALFVSCSTTSVVEESNEPDFYEDEFGIIHRRHVSPSEVAGVRIVNSEPEVGCRRLRDYVIPGLAKDWAIKTEAAKQGATHVMWIRIREMSDTLGVPYDCKKSWKVSGQRKLRELYMQRKAMEELERRRRSRGEPVKLTPVDDPHRKPSWMRGI